MSRAPQALPTEELGGERRALDLEMRGDVRDNAGERSDADARVVGDRHVMFAALMRRQPQVTPCLTGHPVAVATECPREVAP